MNIMFMTLLMDMDNILSVEEPEKVCQLFLFNLFSPSVTGIFFIFHTKKLLQNYLSWNKETSGKIHNSFPAWCDTVQMI